MVAGAGGIDFVVLIIAADEGVMPQTREHLEICSLLGIRHGVVALTKMDLVDPDWLSLVQEDIREFLRGTFLEGAPIVPVSAVKGQGLEELVDALEKAAGEVVEEPDPGFFRLPIDRVFTIKGFGTVVTGTLVSGEVTAGRQPRGYAQQDSGKSAGDTGPQRNCRVGRIGAEDGGKPPGD